MIVLPADLQKIDAETYRHIPAGSVCIPSSVRWIAPDAFPKDMLIFAVGGSYAYSWAVENGYRVIDLSSDDSSDGL